MEISYPREQDNPKRGKIQTALSEFSSSIDKNSTVKVYKEEKDKKRTKKSRNTKFKINALHSVHLHFISQRLE